MTDIEHRLRAAMHMAVDGEDASPGELIRQVKRRHRRHVAVVAAAAALAVIAVAVPVAIALNLAANQAPQPYARYLRPSEKPLPTKMTGLPMPAGKSFQVLIATAEGAAWYSTASHHTEQITGLPASSDGYRFYPVDGGWVLFAAQLSGSPGCAGECAGQPQEYYFMADGSARAAPLGAAFAGQGFTSASGPGAVWLVRYRHSTDDIYNAPQFVQLVSTSGRVGQPLGPEIRLPARTVLYSAIAHDLLIGPRDGGTSLLWDPRTRRVIRRFTDIIGVGPEQIAWSAGCRSCRLQILNVQTGLNVTTAVPAGPANSSPNESFSDDGKLLAVVLPSGLLGVLNTSTGALTVIPGTAVSSAEAQTLRWQNGGHRLIITTGLANGTGPVQIACWQPGQSRLRVTTVTNQAEISELEIGQID